MGAVELSNLEVRTLFEAWGFVPESGNGGHLVMRHAEKDKKVQITAPGRNTPTPYRAIKKAADICGVGVHEFKLGPKTKPRSSSDVIDLDALDRELQAAQRTCTMNGNGHSNGHAVPGAEVEAPPAWRNEDLGPSDRIVEFLKAHPNKPFNKDTICRQTGLKDTQVGAAVSYLIKNRPEEILRPRRGYYEFDDSLIRGNAEEEERQRALQEQVEKVKEESCFTRIAEDKHGRVVLNGPDGEMWIAIRVEPHFHSFR